MEIAVCIKCANSLKVTPTKFSKQQWRKCPICGKKDCVWADGPLSIDTEEGRLAKAKRLKKSAHVRALRYYQTSKGREMKRHHNKAWYLKTRHTEKYKAQQRTNQKRYQAKFKLEHGISPSAYMRRKNKAMSAPTDWYLKNRFTPEYMDKNRDAQRKYREKYKAEHGVWPVAIYRLKKAEIEQTEPLKVVNNVERRRIYKRIDDHQAKEERRRKWSKTPAGQASIRRSTEKYLEKYKLEHNGLYPQMYQEHLKRKERYESLLRSQEQEKR